MRVPRVDEWSASGDPENGAGSISFRRFPIHWWVLDRWLGFGHPHWDWWYRAWGKILPHWGDPFCAAYITIWSQFYWSREEDRATVEIGWDKLPEAVRSSLLARRDAGDDSVDPHGKAASP